MSGPSQQSISTAQELRRSNKMQDFSGINRERSFVRVNSNHHHHPGRNEKKRSHTSVAINMRGKPTLEIYRPPSIYGSQNGLQNPKLNVHAKEFTMNHQGNNLQTSRSIANLGHAFHQQQQNILQHQLQHSKSSGDMLRQMAAQQQQQQQQHTPQSQHIPTPLLHHSPQMMLPASGIPLLQSASSGNILHNPRVHFQTPMTPQPQSGQQFFPNMANSTAVYRPLRQPYVNPQQALKRSKSLSAADSLASKLQALNITSEAPDLGQFSTEVEEALNIAVEDPNKLTARCLMDLVKSILERIVEGRRYSLPGAKLCLTIIEKEKNETFLETLLNTCQQWYQDRDKILRNAKTGEGSKFTAFMWFLTEMSSQLKRRQLQLKTQCEGVTPGLLLLSLLVKCCQACVQPPKSLPEIECLFFVLTSIGRDLEAELPTQLGQLLESVRDGFLASTAAPQIRKTLLQLIELKASNWQLPGSTVLYYYPKMK
ncbi:CBP80/20-dependent translation initiation factor isoform X3 [Chrysoperla carnea]|uniref:CBP80/20-dependent translation initiation factor isoform X3 n=1 Tax=Chrysoperla carnea TaxID=189513 RepID=UPI001D0660E6|nr:CBP80/20-dependent translation initiation factor isoform X3 [Chrysoperla carnea]